jgi:hypothetical protein
MVVVMMDKNVRRKWGRIRIIVLSCLVEEKSENEAFGHKGGKCVCLLCCMMRRD